MWIKGRYCTATFTTLYISKYYPVRFHYTELHIYHLKSQNILSRGHTTDMLTVDCVWLGFSSSVQISTCHLFTYHLWCIQRDNGARFLWGALEGTGNTSPSWDGGGGGTTVTAGVTEENPLNGPCDYTGRFHSSMFLTSMHTHRSADWFPLPQRSQSEMSPLLWKVIVVGLDASLGMHYMLL